MLTAQTANNDGIDLAELQSLQMEKIEEIYLYLIELKKENETLKNKLENIKN